MLKAGVRFKLWLADYFAWINNKMGGDIDAIHKVGEYFIEVWKAAGIDTDRVEFVWASEAMDKEYWKTVIQIAKATTVSRATKAFNIMGRKEGELKEVAQYFYPIMQASDPFKLCVDICQLGMDQRRAGMLSREAAERYKWNKPVVVSHHMLLGLEAGFKPDVIEDFSKLRELLNTFVAAAEKLNNTFEKIRIVNFAADANIAISNTEWLSDYGFEVQKINREATRISSRFSEKPKELKSYLEARLPSITLKMNTLASKLDSLFASNIKISILERTEIGKKIMEIREIVLTEMFNEMNKEINEFKDEHIDSKMSKSKPASSIFIHDTKEEIKSKINTAYCPAKVVENNPMLDYSKHIIFRAFKSMEVERPAKFGGPVSFASYAELEKAFRSGSLHPADLKNSVAIYLDSMVKPVREHFEKNAKARKLYEFVKKQEVTR